MITNADTEHIAKLARLEFSDSEVDQLTGELNNIIGYVDQLNELDVSNVEPLENINEAVQTNVFRPDVSEPSLSVEEALLNAPKSADGFFLVPKVIEKGKTTVAIVTDDEDEVYDL
jgi:aspartyl-tRNA(Asn)/glutamyl-tRNA(Gln) amidotransferase subunit C